jgi:hypothetical protein
MKNILLILLVLLTSCRKYFTEKSTITLSGKYVISKVDITSVDQNTSQDSLYLIGSTYINRSLPYPFDSINVNRFYMAFDYACVSINLIGTTTAGRDIWEFNNVFYDNYFNNPFSYGYLRFTYILSNGQAKTLQFYIEEDGFESLQLKSSGAWFNGSNGEKQVMTLFLTRVGP